MKLKRNYLRNPGSPTTPPGGVTPSHRVCLRNYHPCHHASPPSGIGVGEADKRRTSLAGFQLVVPQHPVERVVERGPVLSQPVNLQQSVAVRAPAAFVEPKPVDWGFAAGSSQKARAVHAQALWVSVQQRGKQELLPRADLRPHRHLDNRRALRSDGDGVGLQSCADLFTRHAWASPLFFSA